MLSRKLASILFHQYFIIAKWYIKIYMNSVLEIRKCRSSSRHFDTHSSDCCLL